MPQSYDHLDWIFNDRRVNLMPQSYDHLILDFKQYEGHLSHNPTTIDSGFEIMANCLG
jgi:hypothetical protein